MSIESKIKEIKDEFKGLEGWEERYGKMISIGRKLESLPKEGRQDKFLIDGCQSRVWLYPELKGTRVFYSADSDAAIAKGIVAMLVQVYSGSTPDEIINNKDDFLKDLGITDHLSMNRTNGLKAMGKQIKLYALAYKAMT